MTYNEKFPNIKNNRDQFMALFIEQSYDEIVKLFIEYNEFPAEMNNYEINITHFDIYKNIVWSTIINTDDEIDRHDVPKIQIKISDLINSKLFAYCIYYSDIEFLEAILIVDNSENIFTHIDEYCIDTIIKNKSNDVLTLILEHMNLCQPTIEKFCEFIIGEDDTNLLTILLDHGHYPNIDLIQDAIESDYINSIKLLLETNRELVQTAFDNCVFYDSSYNHKYVMVEGPPISTDVPMVKLLLEYNISISNKLNDLLFYASQCDMLDLAVLCLELKLDCNINNALKISCLNNNLNIMTCLLQNGADINVIDDNDFSDISMTTIKFIIGHGFSFNETTIFKSFYSMLFSECNMDNIAYMLDNGANFDKIFTMEKNHDFSSKKKSWLAFIISTGKIDVMTFLVNNYQDQILPELDRLFVTSIVNGRVNMSEYLLTLGAKLDIHCNDIFVLACYSGHLDSVKYLLDKGIDVNLVESDLFSITSTKKNTFFNDNPPDNFIDIYTIFKNNNGWYGTQHLDILKLLIGYEIRIPQNNIFTSCSDTIIDVEIINYLITHGFDIHEEILMGEIYLMSSGKTFRAKMTNLLELSVYHRKIKVVKFLLEHKMNPNINNANAIQIATKFNSTEIKKLLLEYCQGFDT